MKLITILCQIFKRTRTKFELCLYIHNTHPCIKFELSVCNSCRDNDQKVNDDHGLKKTE